MWKSGERLADEAADADVLHDGRIHSGGDDGAQILFCALQFVRKDQSVERHVAAHAPAMQKLHELRQVRLGEVMGAHPGVELVEAEVDGVCTVLHGGFRAFPIASRGEQFRQTQAGLATVGGSGRFSCDDSRHSVLSCGYYTAKRARLHVRLWRAMERFGLVGSKERGF